MSAPSRPGRPGRSDVGGASPRDPASTGGSLRPMEFRRINGMPPYVLAITNELKQEARRAGADVIDFGFGNPDLPSPEIAVEKLAEAARNERNHRYSQSKGIPKLREAVRSE